MSNKKTIGFVNNGLSAPRLKLTKSIRVGPGNIPGPAASAAPGQKYPMNPEFLANMNPEFLAIFKGAPPQSQEEMIRGYEEYQKFLKTPEGQRRAAARARIDANNSLTNEEKREEKLFRNRGGKSTKRTTKHKSKRRHSRRK